MQLSRKNRIGELNRMSTSSAFENLWWITFSPTYQCKDGHTTDWISSNAASVLSKFPYVVTRINHNFPPPFPHQGAIESVRPLLIWLDITFLLHDWWVLTYLWGISALPCASPYLWDESVSQTPAGKWLATEEWQFREVGKIALIIFAT